MFENIGNKIKGLAIFLAIIGIGGSIFVAIFSFGIFRHAYFGITLLILGPLVSYFSSAILYGFGHLIENSDKLVAKNNDKIEGIETTDSAIAFKLK